METSDKKNENKINLIHEELIKLFENITNYFAVELQDYLGLINFFEQVSIGIKDISTKIKIPKTFNVNNPDFLNLNSFFNFHSLFLNNLNEIPDKINTDVLSTLKNFKEEFELDNKNIFFSLNTIIDEISNQKNILNKRKKEFEEEKNKNKDYKKSLKTELYSKEIDITTKLYSNHEKKFFEIIKRLEENETKKNKIISNCLYIYFKMIFEDLDSLDNQRGDIKKLIKLYKIKQDKKSIKCLNLKPVLLTSFYLFLLND